MNQLKLVKMDLRSKFRGSLLGSLMGDCLGAPYEGDVISPGEKIVIQRYFDKLETPGFKGPTRCYTDDTAMMKGIATSLIASPDIDYQHMAKSFTKEYYQEPQRGYGANVIEVFQKLRKSKFQDVFKPASEQFNGSGSFGNGAAMRIAPIALYCHGNYKGMLDAARKSALITHSNTLGVDGAILQAISIREALLIEPGKAINCDQFCDEIIMKMKEIEQESDDGLNIGDCYPYEEKLHSVKHFLKSKYHEDLNEEVITNLGNSISAYESVPTALYCFLRAQQDIPTVQTANMVRRTIQYAVSLGGDTDTIACMAGAIAGAYVGEDGIDKNLAGHCESYKEILQLADGLYDAVVK